MDKLKKYIADTNLTPLMYTRYITKVLERNGFLKKSKGWEFQRGNIHIPYKMDDRGYIEKDIYSREKIYNMPNQNERASILKELEDGVNLFHISFYEIIERVRGGMYIYRFPKDGKIYVYFAEDRLIKPALDWILRNTTVKNCSTNISKFWEEVRKQGRKVKEKAKIIKDKKEIYNNLKDKLEFSLGTYKDGKITLSEDIVTHEDIEILYSFSNTMKEEAEEIVKEIDNALDEVEKAKREYAPLRATLDEKISTSYISLDGIKFSGNSIGSMCDKYNMFIIYLNFFNGHNSCEIRFSIETAVMFLNYMTGSKKQP